MRGSWCNNDDDDDDVKREVLEHFPKQHSDYFLGTYIFSLNDGKMYRGTRKLYW